jgi:hypothetical protein
MEAVEARSRSSVRRCPPPSTALALLRLIPTSTGTVGVHRYIDQLQHVQPRSMLITGAVAASSVPATLARGSHG